MEETLQRMYQGKLSPLEAVKEFDREIGGITGAICRKGITIQNHERAYPISTKNLKSKQAKTLAEFVTLAYWQAQKNGSERPGEIHLGKSISTKHYRKGFDQYLGELLRKYA